MGMTILWRLLDVSTACRRSMGGKSLTTARSAHCPLYNSGHRCAFSLERSWHLGRQCAGSYARLQALGKVRQMTRLFERRKRVRGRLPKHVLRLAADGLIEKNIEGSWPALADLSLTARGWLRRMNGGVFRKASARGHSLTSQYPAA